MTELAVNTRQNKHDILHRSQYLNDRELLRSGKVHCDDNNDDNSW